MLCPRTVTFLCVLAAYAVGAVQKYTPSAAYDSDDVAKGECPLNVTVSKEVRHGSRPVVVSLPPFCNCSKIRIWSNGGDTNGDFENYDVKNGEVNIDLTVSGYYRAEIMKSWCTDSGGTCVATTQHCESKFFVEGVDLGTWNITISVETITLAHMYKIDAWVGNQTSHGWSGTYFNQLWVELYVNSSQEHRLRNRIAYMLVNVTEEAGKGPPGAHVLFPVELSPEQTPIAVVVKQKERFSCWWGSDRSCKNLYEKKDLPKRRSSSSVSTAADGGYKAVYIASGCLLGLAAAAVVIICLIRSRRLEIDVRNPRLVPTSAASAATSVLLIHDHLIGEARQLLDALTNALRGRQFNVLDIGQTTVLKAFLTSSVSDMLTSEALCKARLVFVTSSSVCTARSDQGMVSQLRQDLLRHVRNSQLALDYRRVFVVGLGPAGDRACADLAGLTPGRVFNFPDDVEQLVQHLGGDPMSSAAQNGVSPGCHRQPQRAESPIGQSSV